METAQEALQKSQETLHALFAASPLALTITDSSMKVMQWNAAAEKIFGWKAEEVIGQILPIVPDSEVESNLRLRARAFAGEAITAMEVIRLRKDGSLVPISLSLAPLRDGQGNIVSLMSIAEDITLRKQAEEQIRSNNIELEKRVAQRTSELKASLNELEVFAYSISHDLKAPLRGIEGYSALLEQDYGDAVAGDGQEYLANIRKATRRMNELIDGLLEYSRLERRKLTPAVVDPKPMVEMILVELAPEINRLGAQIVLNLPYMRITADAEGLAQALRNLLDNSLKFSRANPSPIIEIGGEMKPDSAVLWVKDNGIGFDMRFHDQIFEIFRHLHRVEDYPGTGIGLAIVRKAMGRMGGRVWASSEPGKGATFFLSFPK